MEDSVFNHSRSGLAESVIDAIEIIADKKLSSAKFDRTIQATVLSCTSNTKGEYRCRYQDSKFLAYAPNPDVIYSENALVYILIPGNDWDATKTIIGTVDKLGVDYIAAISNKDYFDPIGNNVIENEYEFTLNTWDGSFFKILYDKDNNIDLIGMNIEKVQDYFTNSMATHFYIQADIQSDIDPTQKLGHYGFKITTSRASKEGAKEYYFLSDEMEGDPNHFINYSTQNNIKKPFLIETTLDNNEEINNFGEIIKIEAFVDNYYQQSGHPTDITIRNIQLIALHKLSEMEMTDGYLSIVTPSGSVFYLNEDEAIIPSLIKLIAKVRMNGIVSEDNDIKYYWFRQDARVYGGSDFEQYYCPLSGVNTNSWACLNSSTIESGKRLWSSATNELSLSPNDAVAKKNYYKCVAIYDNIIMEREIIIQNKAAQYDITINSTNGFRFFQDQGDTVLSCHIDWGQITPSSDVHYYWGSLNSEGVFNSEFGDRSTSDIIEAISIIGFTKYFCTVYADNSFIGTCTAILTNSDITTAGTYYLNITNGDQLFKYDEEGRSPISIEKDPPQYLQPLEVEFYDSQGNQLTSEEVLRSTNIKWYFPKYNSMLIAPNISECNPYSYIDPTTGLEYIVYENIYNLPFDILANFNYNALYNQIKLTVEFNGNVYIDKTNFSFIKEGELGTNGTKYSCRIVPNATSDFNLSRVWITEKADENWSFNFTYNTNEFPFKVLIYRNSELLYSNYASGTSHDIHFNIKWEICGSNEHSLFTIENNNTFIYNHFPTEIPENFNNLLKVTVDINTVEGKILYSFLPIGVTKIKNIGLNSYNIGLYEKDGIFAGFTQAIYNVDGENPLYNELYPFDFKIFNVNKEDVTENYKPNTSTVLIGSNIIYDNTTMPQSPNYYHIIPTDDYEGLDVSNAVLYTHEDFDIYAPIVFIINRYGLASLNAWDGTSIKIDEDAGYIYAPQMGAGIKENDNSFSGVLLGKVEIPNSNDKLGFMAYGKGKRTVWIDAYTGIAEFGADQRGKIIIDPSDQTAKIYGGNYSEVYRTGMLIDLTTPSIKFGSGNFELSPDGTIIGIKMQLKKNNSNFIYYELNEYGLILDTATSNVGAYAQTPPSEFNKKVVIYDSSVDPEAALMTRPSNSLAEFGQDGIILQCHGTKSYLFMKQGTDETSKGWNVALKSGNALYLESGIQPSGGVPIQTGEDTANASVNIKAAYNANINAGHGLNIRVTKPHEKDGGQHQYYPDPVIDDSYGYMKLETKYGWLYMSSKAGGKKGTPGIGINAYLANDPTRETETEEDPYYGKDYKVYINGNEVLDAGNAADATGGDLGGAVYVSEFGNLRPYLDRLVSLGSYYEEGDGIAAWRHVVTYDTIQVSDKREKDDIEDLDSRYIDFIMNLKPKKYHYKKTGEKEYRTGFIAQDVEVDLNNAGLNNEDFGGLKKKPINMYGKTVDYGYGLNYDDFVAALVLTVQDLQKQINELKEKKYGT